MRHRVLAYTLHDEGVDRLDLGSLVSADARWLVDELAPIFHLVLSEPEDPQPRP